MKHIKEYSVTNWGREIARQYFEEFAMVFRFLATQPAIGRDRSDDIGKGYRSYGHKSHVIYYKTKPADKIMIVAILHHSMLPEKHLEKRTNPH